MNKRQWKKYKNNALNEIFVFELIRKFDEIEKGKKL